MAGTFGMNTPFVNPANPGTWGISPFGAQGLSINPFALQQLYGQPLAGFGSSPSLGHSLASQPLQQVVQLLQAVPQQLQQLEYLQLQQLQQLQQVQQLVRLIPAQLAQLQQPFGQPGAGSSITLPLGIPPQIFGPQPSHVM